MFGRTMAGNIRIQANWNLRIQNWPCDRMTHVLPERSHHNLEFHSLNVPHVCTASRCSTCDARLFLRSVAKISFGENP